MDGTLENQINKIRNVVIITCTGLYCVDNYDLYGTHNDIKNVPYFISKESVQL